MYTNAIYYLYNHPYFIQVIKYRNVDNKINRLYKNLELKTYLGLVSKTCLGTEFECRAGRLEIANHFVSMTELLEYETETNKY